MNPTTKKQVATTDIKTLATTSVSLCYSVFSDTAQNAVFPSFIQNHKTR